MKLRKRGNRRPDRHARRSAWDRPSTYIHDLSTITAGTPVWLWCRVSSGLQHANGNNVDQEAALRAAAESRGGDVVDVTAYVGVAYGAAYETALYEAAKCAAHAGAVLFAESTSRFVRHPEYSSRNPRRPGADDLRTLHLICGDVPLVAMIDPDATVEEERSHQTKRGQDQKGNKGGRPPKHQPGYKMRRQHQTLPKVRWMKRVGMSNRAIGKVLGIAESSVRRWVRHFLRHRDADTCD